MAKEQEFVAQLQRSWPAGHWHDLGLLLAVSGGADSVALLRAMAALKNSGGGALVVAHFNHRLQRQSERHEGFVRELAANLGLACEVGQPAQPLEEVGSDGLEAAARAARYEFLQATAERLGARYVVTAHTADDQIETILHRVVRGTGLAGLAGIPRVRPLGSAVTLMRPLLGHTREQVLEYLTDLGQPYCDDASNAELHFTRNRIRHELLPQLARDYNPGVADALLRLGQLAGEAQGVLEPLIDKLFEQAVVESNESVVIDSGPVREQPRYLARELFKRLWREQGWPEQSMGFAQWELLAELLLADDPGRCETLPGGVSARKQGTKLLLSG
jgi:tRNA(Ile)-lysidine synthase